MRSCIRRAISWCQQETLADGEDKLLTDGQFQLVYNILSFSLASTMATTSFLWLRVPCVSPTC